MRAVRVRDVNSKQFASMSLFLPIPTNQIESFIAKFQAIQAKLPSQPRKYKNRRRNPNRGGKKEENVVLVMITGSSSNKLYGMIQGNLNLNRERWQACLVAFGCGLSNFRFPLTTRYTKHSPIIGYIEPCTERVESSFSWLPPLLRSTFLRIQSFVGKRRLWARTRHRNFWSEVSRYRFTFSIGRVREITHQLFAFLPSPLTQSLTRRSAKRGFKS
ncbi:predicted protein [Sclerotinia sclerotiorum 1980 UF-70]|uniref:Uncharacterized protein n=1 Tax=Sclerotinia sclerotiorum (strain ATCC 18683 / 1980 / Ss-1) TaxID=665079 RepID=A7EIW6_SCLS1|nr:predicted protein [Sclerotinia sclerotiorum 1980 UF-70]EDO02782.1 predicted protein [Sclerotinia sclerotiorum 1980 UF-70]